MLAALRARFKPEYEELPIITELMTGAVAHAEQRGSAVLGLRTLLHYLLVAKPPALVAKLLDAYDVRPDSEALQERAAQSGTTECPSYSDQVMTVLARVIVQCESAGMPAKAVNELDLLAALASEPESAQLLEQLGLARLQILYFRNLGHALPTDPAQEFGAVEDPTLPAWVRIDNDHYSTMEFVSDVLQHSFELETEPARRLMLEIHRCGAVLLGPYPLEVARERTLRALTAARAAGQPLAIKLSRQGAWHDKAATPRQMWSAMWHETSGGHHDGLLSFAARHWRGERTIGAKYVDLRLGMITWSWLGLLFVAFKLQREGPLWLFVTLVILLGSVGTWVGVGYWTNASDLRRRGIRPRRATLLQVAGVLILVAVLAACVSLLALRRAYSLL